ncbi:MAG: caspase family protein, partial [Xanthobacteraceae bacterium]
MGFEVVTGTDLSLTGFAQIMDAFREKAKGADVALMYYAGHAMQFEEQNWLMPIDTRATSAFDVHHYNIECFIAKSCGLFFVNFDQCPLLFLLLLRLWACGQRLRCPS